MRPSEHLSSLSPPPSCSEIRLYVGPEGGFTDAEVPLLKQSGAHLASLGGARLRTETAAIAAAAIMMDRLAR